MFRIEPRETHKIFSKDEIQSKILDLSFNQKIQNIIGMQIADLVAYPIGKWVLDSTRKNKAFEIIEPKLHKKYGAQESPSPPIFDYIIHISCQVKQKNLVKLV